MKYLYNSPRHPCPRRGKARKTALNKGVQSRARVCFSVSHPTSDLHLRGFAALPQVYSIPTRPLTLSMMRPPTVYEH
jgi:hypothetical protein